MFIFLGRLWAVVQKTRIRAYGRLSRSLRYLLKEVIKKFILLKIKNETYSDFLRFPATAVSELLAYPGICSSNPT